MTKVYWINAVISRKNLRVSSEYAVLKLTVHKFSFAPETETNKNSKLTFLLALLIVLIVEFVIIDSFNEFIRCFHQFVSRIFSTNFSQFEKLKKKTNYLELNEYETGPYFIQFSQSLTSDCLLISVFLLIFTWCDHKIVLQIKTKQFYDHIMQKLVKTDK